MLKLHGFAVSNYHNMVQHALMEKGIEFEEVSTPPNQEPEYLKKSPMGKIPCLETSDGFLAETTTILDYLEETHPDPALYPSDPYARAKAKEIIKMVELYIELPARRHLGFVVFGGEKSQTAYDEVRPEIEKGLAALKKIMVLDPYAAGSELSYADIFTLYATNLANRLTQAVYEWDILAEIDGLGDALELVRSSEVGKKVARMNEAAMKVMMARREQ